MDLTGHNTFGELITGSTDKQEVIWHTSEGVDIKFILENAVDTTELFRVLIGLKDYEVD